MRSWMIAAATGLVLVAYVPRLPPPVWLILGLLAVATLLVLRRWRSACFVLGVCYAITWGGELLGRHLPAPLEGQNLLALGRVCSIPTHDDFILRFDFCAEQLADPITRDRRHGPIKLKLSWYHPEAQLGETEPPANQPWVLEVRLKRPHGFLNPAGFDRETWLFRNGYGATGYVRSLVDLSPGADFSWLGWVSHLRQSLLIALRDSVKDLQHGASLEALTLGLKDRLDARQWDVLARTGTSHLLVISGMHIGLFAGVVFALVRGLWLRLPASALRPRAEVPAGYCAIVAAATYALLSGSGIPAQRAFLMIALATGALVAMRKWRASTVYASALVGVLLLEPVAVRSAGFWLSFGAVAAIGLTVAGRLRRRHSVLSSMVRVQWGITVLLAPLLLFWFDQVSWVSLLVNLVAVPLVTIWIAPLALLGVALLPLSQTLAVPLLWLADLGLVLFWWLIEAAASPSWAAQQILVPGWWMLPLLLLGVFAVAPRNTPGRGLLLVFILVALYPPETNSPGRARVVLLDVGQGLAAYGSEGEQAWVYDTGPRFSDHFDAGAAVVVPNLQAAGVVRLERVLVSHGDSDHAGGLGSLLTAIPATEVLSGEPERLPIGPPAQGSDVDRHRLGEDISLAGSEVKRCQAGQQWRQGLMNLRVLWPVAGWSVKEGNNRSCVVQVEIHGWRLLLPGDLDANTERHLVRHFGDELRSDLLLLAHHGSKYSSSPEFLRTVAPRVALVSAGYRNRFRHPPPETRARIETLGIPLLNTAEQGAISLEFGADRLYITSERSHRPGYWFQRPDQPATLSLTRNP